ncbi:MAG TPA: hypothetical protein VJL89_12450 [Thermodesulfovibrionia bacterium]|nr:hypothetical protein [Thermodesulfovibrionia bacterium]
MDYEEALEALKKGNTVCTTGGKLCFLFNNVIYADCDIGNMSGPVSW